MARCPLHCRCHIEKDEEFCALTRGVLAELREDALIRRDRTTKTSKRESGRKSGQKTAALRIMTRGYETKRRKS